MQWLKFILTIGNDVQQKGWYASKTVWFNILSFVAAIAALKGFNIDAQDVAAIAGGVSTVGNIILRAATSVPIGKATVPSDDASVDHPDRTIMG